MGRTVFPLIIKAGGSRVGHTGYFAAIHVRWGGPKKLQGKCMKMNPENNRSRSSGCEKEINRRAKSTGSTLWPILGSKKVHITKCSQELQAKDNIRWNQISPVVYESQAHQLTTKMRMLHNLLSQAISLPSVLTAIL